MFILEVVSWFLLCDSLLYVSDIISTQCRLGKCSLSVAFGTVENCYYSCNTCQSSVMTPFSCALNKDFIFKVICVSLCICFCVYECVVLLERVSVFVFINICVCLFLCVCACECLYKIITPAPQHPFLQRVQNIIVRGLIRAPGPHLWNTGLELHFKPPPLRVALVQTLPQRKPTKQ